MKSLYFMCFFIYAFAQDTKNNTNDGIERPCKELTKSCVRDYLKDHSKCKPVNESVPEPLVRSQSTIHLARLNLTVSSSPVEYSGFDGDIVEFYVNKKNDQVVLAVEFHDATFKTNNSYFIFYRRAQEPVVNKDFYFLSFSSVIITAIIPHVDNLQYARSEHFSYSNDPISRFAFGPNAFGGKDPVAQQALLGVFSDKASDIIEIFVTEGPYMLANFIQYSLCDFGLKVI